MRVSRSRGEVELRQVSYADIISNTLHIYIIRLGGNVANSSLKSLCLSVSCRSPLLYSRLVKSTQSLQSLRWRHLARGVLVINMGNAEQSRDQPATEKPVESVEGDGKGEGANTADAGVTDTQWRSMMDVLLAIYDYREEE